jgi:hypothetical protein
MMGNTLDMLFIIIPFSVTQCSREKMGRLNLVDTICSMQVITKEAHLRSAAVYMKHSA